jgi:hypothetical protein
MQSTIQHPPPPSPTAAPSTPADWQEPYLDALADTGQKAQAARLAGITLRLVVRHRKENPPFARNEAEAMEASFDLWESEAIRRAVEGVAVSRQGRNGEMITRIIYSDTLLLKILQHYLWNNPSSRSNDPKPAEGPERAERAEGQKKPAAPKEPDTPTTPQTPPPKGPSYPTLAARLAASGRTLADFPDSFDPADPRVAAYLASPNPALAKAVAESIEQRKRALHCAPRYRAQPPNQPQPANGSPP